MAAIRPEGVPTLGETVTGLASDVQDLVRGEMRLARAELDQKLHHLIGAAIGLTGGALVGFAGLVTLLQGSALALAKVMPAWAAFLVVGIVIALIGAVLVRSGLTLISLKTISPDRTAANLQKDAHLIKEHTS